MKTVLLFFALLITGCDAQRASMLQENERLKTEVSQLKEASANRQAEIDYMASQASIAAGCDYLIPVCPASAVDTGRKALAGGYGGTGGWLFWLAFILKWLAVGAAVGGCVGVSIWIWQLAGKPEKTKADEARKAIAQAQEKANLAVQIMKKSQAAEQAAGVGLREVNEQIQLAENQLAAVQQKIETESKKLDSIKAAAAALRAFSS